MCKPRNGYPQIDFLTEVSSKTKEGINKLREIIYSIATGLSYRTSAGVWETKRQDDKIVGRKVVSVIY